MPSNRKKQIPLQPPGCLTPQQTERFYFLWRRLLRYTNQQRDVAKGFLAANVDADLMPVEVAADIRNLLWADDSLLEAYLRNNPDQLSTPDLALVESWKQRIQGTFAVVGVVPEHAIFLFGEDEEERVFGVKGLISPLDEVCPYLPCYVQAVLLPFEDSITYDSFLTPYNVMIGPNMQADWEAEWADAVERGAVVTTLGSSAHAQDPLPRAQNTNARVLKAYEQARRATSASDKLIQRDLQTATTLASDLANSLSPHSLRDLNRSDLEVVLQMADALGSPAEHNQLVASLKRLVRFLLDSGRLDWDEGEMILVRLRESRR